MLARRTRRGRARRARRDRAGQACRKPGRSRLASRRAGEALHVDARVADPPRRRARLSGSRPPANRRARRRPGRGPRRPPTRRRSRPCSRLAPASGVAVVPFGGGTSVVGGVEALRGRHAAVIALDLRATARRRGRSRPRSPPRLGPGLRGPEAEAALGAHGLTLGHFPQSFEYATIGGFAATRSAGQASAATAASTSSSARSRWPRRPARCAR